MNTETRADKVPEMVTIADASKRSGIRYEAIRGMCITGAVVCIRIGRKYLINWDSMLRYLKTGEKQRHETHIGGGKL